MNDRLDQRERARDYLREEWDGERSLSEIADELDVSQQTVHRAKRELEEKGEFTTPIENSERETGDSGWAAWKGMVNRRTVTALAVVGVVVLAVGLLVSFGSPLISGASIDDPIDGIGGTGGNDTESNGAEADDGTDGGDGTEGGAGTDGGSGTEESDEGDSGSDGAPDDTGTQDDGGAQEGTDENDPSTSDTDGSSDESSDSPETSGDDGPGTSETSGDDRSTDDTGGDGGAEPDSASDGESSESDGADVEEETETDAESDAQGDGDSGDAGPNSTE